MDASDLCHRLKMIAKGLRQIRHLIEGRRAAVIEPAKQLSSAKGGLAMFNSEGLELGA